MPRVLHQTLAEDPVRKRTIIIGDVHGCLDELKQLLDKAEYDATTTRVVLVGDLVNKGPYSAACVSYARKMNFNAVRGNHDVAALRARARREALRDGGASSDDAVGDDEDKYAYTDAWSAADVAYLEGLPYTLHLAADGVLVVHAGLVPGVALEDQSVEAMCTMRNLVTRDEEGARDEARNMNGARRVRWLPTPRANEGEAWAAIWRPGDGSAPADVEHIVFGHDAKRGLQRHEFTTGLDTGACYGRDLTALVLPERRLVSVRARRVYSAPGGG